MITVSKNMVFQTVGGTTLPLTPEKVDYNIVWVTILSPKNKKGEQEFVMQWKANNIGKTCNEVGIRSQYFFGNIDSHIADFTKKDYKYEIRTKY